MSVKSQRGPVAEMPVRRFDPVALVDLLIILAVLVGVKQSVLSFSYLYAGPASTFSAMLVATLLLRRRGLGWKYLGLRWPENWWKTVGLTLFSMALFIAATQLMQLFADAFFEDVGTSGRFDHIEGNLAAYIGIMLLVWTHGSFFEELLFRAFVIDRTSKAFGGSGKAEIGAALFSSIFFGYRHYYYQGMHGALITGAGGFAFAMLYLWFGRKNIMPLIFAHGIFNSLGQTFRFLGIRD
ncbi:type II CAAX endopeptidase family protein [uncultured Parasphingorhabdus sp.]|uniref:CPBP family intramembrane glutamic endopeptidase n=1 Tax=uncultured Parasphingorhabdus sp. TaxID=2709694 RepID=UPI002AA940AD|nr:type II CAAX endopeptidase family protein [uncultured Parasphingorhabdus sp.]